MSLAQWQKSKEDEKNLCIKNYIVENGFSPLDRTPEVDEPDDEGVSESSLIWILQQKTGDIKEAIFLMINGKSRWQFIHDGIFIRQSRIILWAYVTKIDYERKNS